MPLPFAHCFSSMRLPTSARQLSYRHSIEQLKGAHTSVSNCCSNMAQTSIIRTNVAVYPYTMRVVSTTRDESARSYSNQARVDGEDHGAGRALHEAIIHDHLPQLALLLRYGAEVDCQTFDGEFPLNLAIAKNDVKAIRLLLDAGADPNLKTACGYSILHTAAQCGNVETLDFLASAGLHGLNSNLEDQDGHTALNLFEPRCDGEYLGLQKAFRRLLQSEGDEGSHATLAADLDVDAEEYHDAMPSIISAKAM